MLADSDLPSVTDPAQPPDGLWRSRDFRLIWSGQALSELGTGVSQLAYPLLMLVMTGSASQAGALAAVRAFPYVLFGLPAGVIADRWDRKRLMVLCDAMRAALMLSIPVAWWLGHLTPAQLYVTGFLGGSCYVFFAAAESGALPNVVDQRHLTAAISTQQVAGSVGSIVAPPLGGALFSVFPGLPFLTDAVSFGASAFAVGRVRARFENHHADRAINTVRRDAAEGLRWLWRHSAVRNIALTAAGLQVAISGVSLLVIVSAHDQQATPTATGMLLAGVGVGGVLGALVTPAIQRHLKFGSMLLAVMWAQAGLWILFAVSPGLVFTGLVLAAFALSMPVFGIAAQSYLLAATPDALRGRVTTSFGLLTWGATPIGAAAVGLLLTHLTPAATSWCFATWVVTVAAVTTSTGTVRGLRSPTTPTGTA